MTSRALYERTIPVSPLLAEHLGSVAAAMVLQQLHYWLTSNGCRKREGIRWVAKPIRTWEQELVVYNEKTIRRAFDDLEERGYVVADSLGSLRDRTKWYRIDYAKLPSFGHDVPLHSDTMSNSLDKGKTPLENKASPSDSHLQDPPITVSPETKKTLMKIAKNSADIVAQFAAKNPKKTTLAPEKKNTGASAAAIWRDTVPKHNEVKMLPALTGKERGQFSHFAKRCGLTTDHTIEVICTKWIAFTKYVASAKGLKKTPDLPDIAFALLYLGEAMNFAAGKEVQLTAPSSSKGSILGGTKGIGLKIIRPKATLAPAPAVKGTGVQEPETETEGVASLEDILKWAPAKKE